MKTEQKLAIFVKKLSNLAILTKFGESEVLGVCSQAFKAAQKPFSAFGGTKHSSQDVS